MLHIKKVGYAIGILVISMMFMLGCGDKTQSASAEIETQVQDGNAKENTASEENVATEENEVTENLLGTMEEQPEQTSASVAQMEIDEDTRIKLTQELLEENNMDTSVVDNMKKTKGCTFSLPEDFVESEEIAGLYVTGRYPIDASSIYYVTLDQDIALQLMTKETFKEQMEEEFKETYGQEISLNIDEYEKTKIDGCPAFRVLCHYTVGHLELTQLEYIINADKTYVITYSQTNEYDRTEEFEASAATIRMEY